MFLKSFSSLFLVMMLLVSVGCSGANFIPVRPGAGEFAGKTLGLRTVSSVEALAPTDKKSWLEYCIPEVTYTWKVFKNTSWDVPCSAEKEIQPTANHSVATGYVAGIAGPVLQAGAIVGGAALIRDGMKHSGSTNNTNVSGGNSSANSNATGGAGGVGKGGKGGNGFGGQGGNGGNGGNGGGGGEDR
jgi:hypothetical protein